MKNFVIKIKNIFKKTQKMTGKEKIITTLMIVSFFLTLVTYNLTKSLLYAIIPTFLGGIISTSLFIFYKDKSKQNISKLETYKIFYQKLFTKLDLTHNIRESLIEVAKTLSGTELATKIEKYLEDFESNKNMLPPIEYFHTLEELDLIRYLQKGLSKTKVTSTYLSKLYQLYKSVYSQEKFTVNINLVYLLLLFMTVSIIII